MENTDSKIVVVTGASGFLGRAFIQALNTAGYRVRALTREAGNGQVEGAFQTVVGDILEPGIAERILEGAHGVAHLAGIVGKVGVAHSEYWQVHVTSTRRLLEAARANGLKKFLYCSSAGITGNVKKPPADETAQLALSDVYDITKAHGEITALAGGGRGNLEVTVVRPAVAYGPGDVRRLWYFRAIASGRFTLMGNGENLVHPVYIDDLSDGMLKAFEAPEAAGKIYILGGDKYLKLKEWILLIAAQAGVEPSFLKIPYYPARAAAYLCEKAFGLAGVSPPLYRRYTDFFMKNRAYNIALAKAELGYSPKVSLERGAAETLRWYRNNGMI
ncbi:MAG: NAD-dependent epimerase/dehydratase family protein [Nitrospinota bacterium]|nr:NAD-dependent epimerase/dehydratase family protein [Nitrospinota bacterium]